MFFWSKVIVSINFTNLNRWDGGVSFLENWFSAGSLRRSIFIQRSALLSQCQASLLNSMFSLRGFHTVVFQQKHISHAAKSSKIREKSANHLKMRGINLYNLVYKAFAKESSHQSKHLWSNTNLAPTENWLQIISLSLQLIKSQMKIDNMIFYLWMCMWHKLSRALLASYIDFFPNKAS